VTRFWTSDLHFGHANIIKYCNRPFTDVGQMNAKLVNNWNEVVGQDDEVWVLGDVAMGSIEQSLAFVRRLNGVKTLVTGNHDRCWSAAGAKSQRWVEVYQAAGFNTILHGTIEIVFDDQPAVACHFPYAGDSQDADRYTALRPEDLGRTLLHGHVHDRWQVSGRQINVGVDVWDYRPVSDAQLLAALSQAGDEPGQRFSEVVQ
jgi:calcineurin-like phosphoesterase family protein